MLNEKGIRELAYIAEITDVRPIEGYDRVELVVVNDGWTCVVGKGQFSKGDLAVYFEIDSKLPEREPFSNNEFIVRKKYKVQTQKMCKSISQGLIMGLDEFGFDPAQYKKGDFLTEQLGVTYAVKEDNIRKGIHTGDKYKRMAQKHPKAARTKVWRFFYQHNWGKKLLYVFFGHEKKRNDVWPVGKFPGVNKTDQERVENMPWILNDKEPWIATEKIDGTSTTFTIKRRGSHGKYDFFVCSRNVVFDKPDKKCFYETNVYTEMAEKYNIESKMSNMLFVNDNFANCEWITIQGETYGEGVQKRDYSLKGHNFMTFNLIDSQRGRWNTIEMKNFLEKCGIPCVPVVDENYILPDSIDELLTYATGKSVIDNEMREGIVFRSLDGTKSFKAVSNEFLLKYHQ